MALKERQCPHCGTRWLFETRGNRCTKYGGMSGFIEATIGAHVRWCQYASKKDRLDFINRNEKRLAKKPNLHTTVFFNRFHFGVEQ